MRGTVAKRLRRMAAGANLPEGLSVRQAYRGLKRIHIAFGSAPNHMKQVPKGAAIMKQVPGRPKPRTANECA